MAKHRAEKSRRTSSVAPRRRPRHRRRRKLNAVVPVTALAVIAGGGMVAAGADEGSRTVGLGDADASLAAAAAVMASREELLTSRGGSRVLRGAERLESIEKQAKRTLADIREREELRKARERAAEERRQEAIEARQWGSPIAGYSISAVFGETSYLWSSGVHTGVDLNAVTGTPVTSVGPGTVTSAGY